MNYGAHTVATDSLFTGIPESPSSTGGSVSVVREQMVAATSDTWLWTKVSSSESQKSPIASSWTIFDWFRRRISRSRPAISRESEDSARKLSSSLTTWAHPKLSVYVDDVVWRTLVTPASWTTYKSTIVDALDLISPFETLQQTRSEQFSKALAKLRSDSSCSIASAIADRIQELEQLSIEDLPEDPMLSVESAEKFFSFAASIPGMSMPDLVLSPRANIVAEWHWSSVKHLSLEFLPTGIISYVLFAPDPAFKNHIGRNAGTASIDTLLRVLAPFNAHRWLREQLR